MRIALPASIFSIHSAIAVLFVLYDCTTWRVHATETRHRRSGILPLSYRGNLSSSARGRDKEKERGNILLLRFLHNNVVILQSTSQYSNHRVFTSVYIFLISYFSRCYIHHSISHSPSSNPYLRLCFRIVITSSLCWKIA